MLVPQCELLLSKNDVRSRNGAGGGVMVIFNFCMSYKIGQQRRGECAFSGRTGDGAEEIKQYLEMLSLPSYVMKMQICLFCCCLHLKHPHKHHYSSAMLVANYWVIANMDVLFSIHASSKRDLHFLKNRWNNSSSFWAVGNSCSEWMLWHCSLSSQPPYSKIVLNGYLQL